MVLATLPFLPDRFPRYVLPLAYSISAGAIAERWQLGKAAILESSQYQIQSTWRVACLGVILLIAFLVVAFMELFGLDALGVIVL